MAAAFERGEYLRRLVLTRERMAERGIDTLVVTDPANMCYLSGYEGLSYYVPQVLVVLLEEEEPLWIGREMDIACGRYTAFLKPENMLGYPDEFVQSETRHPMQYIGYLMGEHSLNMARIGIERDSHGMTARAEDVLQRVLPNATFHDADLLVNWVRAVKSDAEIEVIREAATLAECGMRAGIDAIAEGVRQCDVAAVLYQALIAGAAAFGGEAPNYLSMPTGERAAAPHLTWTDEPFRAGEATNIELGGCRHHYNAGLARTVCVGRPPEKLTALVPVVVEGMSAALAAAVPGATGHDVEAAWRAVISKAGYEKASRIGYSIGIGFPGLSWGERTISLREGDRTILQPNMTFHMILGMWMDDWGFELSEVLRIRAAGEPETFSNVERTLFVKD